MLYILSILNTVRHLYNVILAYFDENRKYLLTPKSLLILGVSIAFIITGMINGIAICV